MGFFTIQCRLVASETVRKKLWDLMANKNTPLINQLLKQVSQHEDFEAWQRAGNVSEKPVRELCKSLKSDPHFEDQPGRFFTSASLMVTYTYQSWFALQRERRRLDGVHRWVNVVKSDAELVKDSGSTLESIRTRAQEVLNQLNAQASLSNKRRGKQKNPPEANRNLMGLLFEMHETMEDPLSQCAIAHLLKNSCQVNKDEEDLDAFLHRTQRKHQKIKQLETQL